MRSDIAAIEAANNALEANASDAVALRDTLAALLPRLHLPPGDEALLAAPPTNLDT
jgi:hypothetical protein